MLFLLFFTIGSPKIYKFKAESITKKLLTGLYRRKHDREETPLLHRCFVIRADVRTRFDEAIDHAAPHIEMRHFTALKADNRLDLISTLQKLARLIDTGFKVMRINTAGKLDLFDLYDLLITASLLLLLVTLKTVLTIIHRAAYGRLCIRGHQNKVKPAAVRIFQRRSRGHDPKLFPIRTNKANLLIADVLVDL